MDSRWPGATPRGLEEARRLYARVVVEHERVRRAGARPVQPSAPLWKPLHDLAFFHGTGRRRAPLAHFCADLPDAEMVPRSVPTAPYRAALRVAVDLAADQLVRQGGGTPWGRGRRRAPESAEAFDALCRALRDADESGAVAAILDEREPPAPATAAALPRVVFDVPGKLLTIGDRPIALPEGLEYEFLRTLATRRGSGEVTPTDEHGVVWKTAVDQLRKRIRKATGRNLLRAVVLSATAPVGGYRLAPDVEVVGTRQIGYRTYAPDVLDRLGSTSRRKPRARDLRAEDEDG